MYRKLVSVQRCSSLTAHGRATISNHFSLATQTTSSHVNRATIHRQFLQISVWQLYADTFAPSQHHKLLQIQGSENSSGYCRRKGNDNRAPCATGSLPHRKRRLEPILHRLTDDYHLATTRSAPNITCILAMVGRCTGMSYQLPGALII